jgi:hypothetical protein
MQTDLENFWQKAEEQFLTPSEVNQFRGTLDSLRARLSAYETLRDREASVFQAVADRLVDRFPDENPKTLERALKHWIAVTRYAAMAMLLNNPDYLEHRLLEWLTDIVRVYRMEEIIACLHESFLAEAERVLNVEGMSLLRPFLEQAKTSLLGRSIAVVTVA